MEPTTKKILIGIGVAIGVGFAIWGAKKMFFTPKNSAADFGTKSVAASYIVTNGFASNVDVVMSFDDDYVTAWATAAKAGAESFQFNGKTYSVKGGKSVKK